MEDVEHSIAILEAIRAMGVSIAIDDYGTGFSSLSYLPKLPVDTLKIDCSFVNDMTADPAGLALVSAIINLAHSLKLEVVAERSIAYLPHCSTAARNAQLCGRRLVKRVAGIDTGLACAAIQRSAGTEGPHDSDVSSQSSLEAAYP
jgi:hypothetical protein